MDSIANYTGKETAHREFEGFLLPAYLGQQKRRNTPAHPSSSQRDVTFLRLGVWTTVRTYGGTPRIQGAGHFSVGNSYNQDILTASPCTTRTMPDSENTAQGQAGNSSLPTTSHAQGHVYIYTQLFCGYCGRYVTDLGGLVTPAFAAEVAGGGRCGPGPDIQRRYPEFFTQRLRAGVEPESGRHGMSGAASSFATLGLTMQPDPRLPRLFLQPWFCFH